VIRRTPFAMTTLGAILLLSGCGRPQSAEPAGAGPKDRAIFVYLSGASGTCTPIMGTYPVEVDQGDTVVWDVLNDCDGDADVEAVDFTVHGQHANPFDGKEQKGRVDRHAQRPLKFKIRDDAEKGRYKYSFGVVNGGRLDPELVVDGRRR
jgi:hypothetical protein